MTKRGADAQRELLHRAVELLGRDGRLGTLPVSGRSMLPTLKAGQLLAVEFRPGRLRRGDVLLLLAEDGLVVHRLVGRARDRLRTRGDGTILFDPPMRPEQVKGRVIAVRDGEAWRDLRRLPARLYGALLAAHGLCWGAVGAVVARVAPGARHRIGKLDQTLLRLAHGLLFRSVHRPTRID